MTPELEVDLRTTVASLHVKASCQELLIMALLPNLGGRRQRSSPASMPWRKLRSSLPGSFRLFADPTMRPSRLLRDMPKFRIRCSRSICASWRKIVSSKDRP
jgi:hypothetical protein